VLLTHYVWWCAAVCATALQLNCPKMKTVMTVLLLLLQLLLLLLLFYFGVESVETSQGS
jgi:hypothetical protein